MKNNKRMQIPGRINFTDFFRISNEYRNTKSGTQIKVGLMQKMKIDIKNSKTEFVLERQTSFKTINEKAITGKSGLGDCVNKYKTGRKIKFIHVFFSNI